MSEQRNAIERREKKRGKSYADYLKEAKTREPNLYAWYRTESPDEKDKRERITDRDLQRIRKLDKLDH